VAIKKSDVTWPAENSGSSTVFPSVNPGFPSFVSLFSGFGNPGFCGEDGGVEFSGGDGGAGFSPGGGDPGFPSGGSGPGG